MFVQDPRNLKGMYLINHRAQVDAVMATHIKHESEEGEAFIYVIDYTIVAGGTDENLLFIVNPQAKEMVHINKIVFSTNDTSTLFEIAKGLTKVGGGTNQDATNLNTDYANESDVILYDAAGSPLVLSDWPTTPSGKLPGMRVGAGQFSNHWDTKDALILLRNGTLAIRVNSTTTGAKVQCALTYFLEEHKSE